MFCAWPYIIIFLWAYITQPDINGRPEVPKTEHAIEVQTRYCSNKNMDK